MSTHDYLQESGDVGKLPKLSEADRIRRLILDFCSPCETGSYLMCSICDIDLPVLVRALQCELEKVADTHEWGGLRFVRVRGDDPQWKGWNVRGNARWNHGWIVYSGAEEVYRQAPESPLDIPFEMVRKIVETKIELGEIAT